MPPAPATNKKQRIVLVGLGRMGHMRLEELAKRKDCDVAAIVDVDKEYSHILGLKHNVPIFFELKDVYEKKIAHEAVWICVPTPVHKDIILLALNNKKHVAVEKPVCSDAEDIRICYECAEANGVQLFCSFQRRFDPSYQKIADLVKKKKLGEKLVTIHTVFRDYPCPPIEFLKKGGCPFHDLAVHDIDFIRSITDEDPCEIFATGSSIYPELKKLGIHDTASVTMKYPSGLVCFLEFSRLSAYGYDQRCEIFGSNGSSARVDYPRQTSFTYASTDGHIEDVGSISPIERFRAAYANEVASFVAICNGQRIGGNNSILPTVTRKDSMMATILSEAAKQSAHYGKSIHLIYKDNDVVHFSLAPDRAKL